MGGFRGRGTVRNSRFSGRFRSKVWRGRCSSPARSASAANISCPSTIPLQSLGRSGRFREPRFWSLAGHPSQNRNRAQSHRSHVQRWTTLTPAKGGRVRCETATSRRAQATLRATVHRYSPPRRGKKVRSLPPDQASGHSGAAHHQSSGVQSDGAAATTHGKQSRDTGTHGSEGMTVSAHSCRMVGALSGKHMHACMALRPSLQRRYSCTRRRNKVRARIRWGRSPPRGAGGGAPCKVKCTRM